MIRVKVRVKARDIFSKFISTINNYGRVIGLSPTNTKQCELFKKERKDLRDRNRNQCF